MSAQDPRTVIIVAQMPDGSFRTSTTTANQAIAHEDQHAKLIEAHRAFYAAFGAELVSITKVEENHDTDVLTWHRKHGDREWLPSKIVRVAGQMRRVTWWKQHAMAMFVVLMAANATVTGMMVRDWHSRQQYRDAYSKTITDVQAWLQQERQRRLMESFSNRAPM